MKKTTVQTYILKDALRNIAFVAPVKTTIPILSHCLVSATEDVIEITATDLDQTLRVKVAAKVPEPFALCPPAHKLFKVLSSLGGAYAKLSVDADERLVVESVGAKFRLPSLKSRDFPPAPTVEGKSVTIDEGVLKDAIRRSSYCAATDETRPALTGTLLRVSAGYVKVVATNGYQLSEATLSASSDSEFDSIVRPGATSMLVRSLNDEGNLNITASDNQICFEWRENTLYAKLSDVPFPGYEAMLGTKGYEAVEINREEMIAIIRRAAIVSSSDSRNSILLSFGPGELTVSSSNGGEFSEKIPVKFAGRCDININPSYLDGYLSRTSHDTIEMMVAQEGAMVHLGEPGSGFHGLIAKMHA